MKKVFDIPENVDITIQDRLFKVKGSRGEIVRDFNDPRYNSFVSIEKVDNKIIINSGSDKRKMKSIVGTIHSHINNMVLGVTKGFEYKMKIFYSHFPITVEVKGDKIIIKNFLGEKNLRIAKIGGKTKIDVKKDEIILSGNNKEDVGQTASNIERACRLSKRDRRIFFDGIYLSEE